MQGRPQVGGCTVPLGTVPWDCSDQGERLLAGARDAPDGGRAPEPGAACRPWKAKVRKADSSMIPLGTVPWDCSEQGERPRPSDCTVLLAATPSESGSECPTRGARVHKTGSVVVALGSVPWESGTDTGLHDTSGGPAARIAWEGAYAAPSPSSSERPPPCPQLGASSSHEPAPGAGSGATSAAARRRRRARSCRGPAREPRAAAAARPRAASAAAARREQWLTGWLLAKTAVGDAGSASGTEGSGAEEGRGRQARRPRFAGLGVLRRMGTCLPALGASAEAAVWERRYFVLGPDGLAYWPPGKDARSGQPPLSAFRFAELAEVTTRGSEVTLRFKALGSEDASLVLRASSDVRAQDWGTAVRSAMAAKLVASLPDSWDVNAIATSRRFVSKQSLPEEIKSIVQQLVDHSFVSKSTRDRRGREMPLRLEVTEVVRVENSAAWIAFDAERTRLHGRASNGAELHPAVLTSTLGHESLGSVLGELEEASQEHWLFHGTTAAAVQGISDSKFRLDLAGSHRGTMYGKGMYLAECSSKADEYAEVDENGNCRMLLCRAALGRVLRNCDRHPKREELEAQCKAGYDSLCGDRLAAVGTFREFVLFNSSQVYPAYIIHYRRIMQTELLRALGEGSAWPGLDVVLHAAKLAEAHPDSVVRYRILLLLGNNATRVVPALIQSLGDERSSVRRIAVGVLRQLAASLAPADVCSEAAGAACMEGAVPALSRCLEDPDARVRDLAAEALERVREYIR